MSNKLNAIRKEFNANEGTFLLILIENNIWNHTKLMKLLEIMHETCKQLESETKIDKDIADGFWYFRDVASLTTPIVCEELGKEYLSSVQETFMFLTDWLFSGDCPFDSHQTFWEDICQLNLLYKDV